MKILLITQIYPGYEQETTKTSPFAVHYFVKEWQKRGHEVEIIRIWPYRPLPFSLIMNKSFNGYAYKETFELDGININRVPVKKIPGVDFTNSEIKKIAIDLQEKVNLFNPDVIISHSISPSYFIGKELSNRNNIPLILVVHKTDITYLNKKNRIKDFNESRGELAGVFFRSPVLENKFYTLLKEKKSESVIIPSGIEKKEILSFKEFIDKGKRQSLNFIVACNLIKLKNVDMIIKAIDILGGYNGNIKLKVIGDGPERKSLEDMVHSKGLQHNVEFLGHLERSEVLKHMSLADVYVMVSSPETFGLVYIEAMAKGCIVIGSKGEGIDGIIRNGENGFLCRVGDSEQLSNIINYCVIMNDIEKKAILEKAYKTAKNLTIEKCAKHYLNEVKKRL